VSTIFFSIPDASPEGLQIRCSIFQRKREQHPSHVQTRNTRFYSSPSTTRVPCVLQIRAGIMEFTCNSALSAVHHSPWRHRGIFAIRTAILPHAFRNMRPVSRIYEISLSSVSPQPALLRSSHWLLNVRQVIYTRGFTTREILRKTLTRTETGVASSWRYSFPERKIIFYNWLQTASYDECCRR